MFVYMEHYKYVNKNVICEKNTQYITIAANWFFIVLGYRHTKKNKIIIHKIIVNCLYLLYTRTTYKLTSLLWYENKFYAV